MDTIENLIIAIVKPLISQPDALTIKIEDTPESVSYTHLDVYKRQDIFFSRCHIVLLKF